MSLRKETKEGGWKETAKNMYQKYQIILEKAVAGESL